MATHFFHTPLVSIVTVVYNNQIRSFPLASFAPILFMCPYHNLNPTAMAAVANEQAAHTKLPVG